MYNVYTVGRKLFEEKAFEILSRSIAINASVNVVTKKHFKALFNGQGTTGNTVNSDGFQGSFYGRTPT